MLLPTIITSIFQSNYFYKKHNNSDNYIVFDHASNDNGNNLITSSAPSTIPDIQSITLSMIPCCGDNTITDNYFLDYERTSRNDGN